MPRTPDPVGTELNLVDVGADPTAPGAISYSGGVLKARDSLGTFDLRSAGSASNDKAGVLIPGNFSGTPKKATVTFSVAFASTSYSIVLSPMTDGSRTFAAAIENKTVNGFVVNLHADNVAGLVEVGWQCKTLGS